MSRSFHEIRYSRHSVLFVLPLARPIHGCCMNKKMQSSNVK